MALKSARAVYGLQGIFDLTSAGTTGEAIVGPNSTVVALPTTGQVWAVNIEVDGAGEVEINIEHGQTTVTSAPVAQVETATAAGTITASGNALVTVTGDDIPGSPLAINVAVVNTDTAATWAGKVRTALNATAAVTGLYTVGGASTAITLTRTVARRNDATLNIALANGTCTGITAAPSSVNTTAGAAPSKCERLPGVAFEEDDAEGKPLLSEGGVYGYLILSDPSIPLGALITSTDGTKALVAGQFEVSAASDSVIDVPPDWTFTAPNGYAKTTLVVITV